MRTSGEYTPRPRVPIGLIVAGIIVLLAPVLACIAWSWQQWIYLQASYPIIADAIRIVTLAAPTAILVGAAYVALSVAWRRYGWRESIYSDKTIALTRAQVQSLPPSLITYTHHEGATRPQAPISAPMLTVGAEDIVLPGMLDLAALDVRPTRDRILLGVDQSGPVTVSVSDLCHVALLGSTGGGKSNLLRLIVPQLQAIGAAVVLADPHFAPVDPESGEDWRPIAERLKFAPAVKADEIDSALDFMTEELERRLEKRNRGEKFGGPIFLAFDELPVITDLVKDAPARLGRLLREGRKVHLLTVGSSQSMLVKEIGGSSTVRDAYRTTFYCGGDRKSASAMLDLAERAIDDGPLGQGIVLLRSKATSPARLVRVPFVSNGSLYGMFGEDSTDDKPAEKQIEFGFRPAVKTEALKSVSSRIQVESVRPSSQAESGQPLTSEALRAYALFLEGKDPTEIVLILRGLKPNQPPKYGAALKEINAFIRACIVAGQ